MPPPPPHPTPPHPTFAKKSLYPFNVTATGLEPRTTWLVNEHSTIWPRIAQLKDSLLFPLPKISKKLSPQKKCHFKTLQLPVVRRVILLLWRL